MNPSVSVVIPCYNTARFVAEAVRSALDQQYENLEIIVVNDGSTDHFETAIAPFQQAIRIVRQPNRGLAAARNRGIDEARGELIALLDADDRWHPSKISRQVAALQAVPSAGVVHTARRLIDADGAHVDSSPLAPTPKRPAQGMCLRELILPGNSVIVSSVIIRRAVLGADRFDAAASGVEDWDMWVRLAARTFFHYVDQPLLDYRVHGGNMSAARRLMARGTLELMNGGLRRHQEPEIRAAALVHRRTALLELANLCYDAGERPEARKWFREAEISPLSGQMVRYMATFMPLTLHRAAQRIWRDYRARVHGAGNTGVQI